jgi:hypothetical protein
MRDLGPVARHVKLPGAYGAAPSGTRPLAAADATHPSVPASPVVTRS